MHPTMLLGIISNVYGMVTLYAKHPVLCQHLANETHWSKCYNTVRTNKCWQAMLESLAEASANTTFDQQMMLGQHRPAWGCLNAPRVGLAKMLGNN